MRKKVILSKTEGEYVPIKPKERAWSNWLVSWGHDKHLYSEVSQLQGVSV